MNELSCLHGSERYEACEDEATGPRTRSGGLSVVEGQLRKSYEQFLDDIAARGYTRFQANGPVLEVDVTDLSELDFPRLMGSLTGFCTEGSF